MQQNYNRNRFFKQRKTARAGKRHMSKFAQVLVRNRNRQIFGIRGKAKSAARRIAGKCLYSGIGFLGNIARNAVKTSFFFRIIQSEKRKPLVGNRIIIFFSAVVYVFRAEIHVNLLDFHIFSKL